MDTASALPGSGAMDARIRAFDWAATPLGPPPAWPAALHTLVCIMLNAQQPMFTAWGRLRTMLYNDAYATLIGQKHPAALGAPFLEVWAEARAALAPLIEQVFAGTPVHMDDIELVLQRHGRPEEAHFAFSYTPVRADPGQDAADPDRGSAVAGLFCVCTDTTNAVLAARRQQFRLRFDAAVGALVYPRDIMSLAAELLGQHLDADRVGYAEIDDTGERVTIETDWCKPGMPSARGVRRMADYGPQRIAELRAGRLVAIEDVATDPRTRAEAVVRAFDGIGMRAGMTVSLVKDGRFLATLFVHHASPRRWTEDERELLTEMADRTWAAVQRARAEDELRAVNETLEQRVEERTRERDRVWRNSRDLLVIVGTDGIFRAVNPAWRATLGYDPDTVVGRSFHDLIWNDDAGIIHGALDTAALRDLTDFENRFRHQDGTPRWLSWRTTTEGDLVYASGRDITADKALAAVGEAQRRLQAFRTDLSEQLRNATEARTLTMTAAVQLGELLGVGSVGYATVDPGGETFTIEHVWARTGFPDISGTHILAAYGPPMLAALGAGQLVRVDDTEHHPFTAGPEMQALYASIGTRAHMTAPLLRDGRLAGSLFVLHPEPRAWTDAECATVDEVAERTWASLQRLRAEEALRQSQKMEAVGQLTGGLAHDFNNLLTGIAGSLELLAARVAQGRLAELDRYIAAAQGAAKRAAALTHRLLAFSRQQTLDPKPTDVNRLIAGMDDLLRRTVGPQVVVEMVAAGGLWTTRVDPNQLENALLNLCINARDAMPDGGRLTVETANIWLDARAARDRDLPPGQYVSLAVSDNGVGMPAEVIRRAFDPFYTTKPIGMGTGLGLSMVYGFARQSNGQARIYSEPGQGAMICLYLPRHMGPADNADLPHDPQPRTRVVANASVLVIDDEPTVRMLVAEVLDEAGFAALEAADGAQGLRVLQSDARVALLITDVGLPGGMNGRQVADAARVLRPALKVLFITGYAENAVVGNGHLDAGMHVMTKPFAMEALARRIRDIIAAP